MKQVLPTVELILKMWLKEYDILHLLKYVFFPVTPVFLLLRMIDRLPELQKPSTRGYDC